MFVQYHTIKSISRLALVCSLACVTRFWWRYDCPGNLCDGRSSMAKWGRQTFNAIYLAQNIGVAAGAALGGFVAEFSFNYIFLANLVMYVLFALVAITQFNLEIHAKVKHQDAIDLKSKESKNVLQQ